MEIWKDIKDYNDYQVSSLGNVKSLKHNRERLLKPGIGGSYKTVALLKGGKQKSFSVHQLVAVAFLNHIPNGYELVVNHINLDKLDNRLENLELITHRENTNKKHLKSSSIFTGVSKHKPSNKWQVKIQLNGVNKTLGLFHCELEAATAYNNALSMLM
jgi:hypothetical protein